MEGMREVVGTNRGDFFTWAQQQVDRLRSGRLDGLDCAGIAEEIEALAQREARAACTLLRRVLCRLALCEFAAAPRHRGRWLAESVMALSELEEVLTPTLRPVLIAELGALWRTAAAEAEVEMADAGLEPVAFPSECPYTWQELFGSGLRLVA